MLLTQILLILRARHWLIWILMLACGAAAYLVSSNMEKRYVSTAQVLVDMREPDALTDRAQSGAIMSASYMGTQNDIIRSDRVVRKVVAKLGLTTNPVAIQQWKQSNSPSPIEQYYAEILRGYLQVVPSRNSNVIGIQFTNPTPSFAAEAANAFARMYIETTVELKTDPERSFAGWFSTQTARERERLDQAQQKLSEFQREHGFVQTDEKGDVGNVRYHDLNSQLTSVQGQRAESSSRAQEARENIETSPDVLQNGTVAALRGDIARQEAKLDELHGRFGPRHPQVVGAQAELDSLKQKLAMEMQRIARSVSTANAINEQRERTVSSALSEQRQRMLQLRGLRDQLGVLQHEVEMAQHDYDVISQRLSQTKLQSQVDQTNLILLSEALTPTVAAGPRVTLISAVGLALGALTGALLALGLEVLRPRLRTVEEAASVLQVRILASLPNVRGRRRSPLLPRLARA